MDCLQRKKGVRPKQGIHLYYGDCYDTKSVPIFFGFQ